MSKQYENVIRWDKKNLATLKIAVNTFNKKLNELKKNEDFDYLPENYSVQELKQEITTQNELKRVVNALRKFKTEGQADLFVNEQGQKMTVWEKNQIENAVKRANVRINKRLDTLYNKKIDGGKYSRAQMGSEEVRTLEKRQKALSKFDEKKGYDFKQFKKYAFFQGSTDYEMKKAIVYEDNYRNVLRRYSSFFGYDFLQEQINKIKSPLEFYEKMKDGDEFSVDLTYQSTQTYTVEKFVEYLKTVFGENEWNNWLDKQGEKGQKYYNEIVTNEENWLD